MRTVTGPEDAAAVGRPLAAPPSLGFAVLPDTHPAMGGLAEEHEDLRLHILPLDAALALIATEEINVGPLVAMLLWAERERGRLRID